MCLRRIRLERGGQWNKDESCDNFRPIDHWLAIVEENDEVRQFAIWAEVGDRIRVASIRSGSDISFTGSSVAMTKSL